jgi:hypothetical protein
MSKLAEVAERLAETRRWLDQEASRLATRLDQLERRAPKVIHTAHQLIDEQLRGLEETERMVQQWLSATAEPAAGKGTPQPHHAAASPTATSSRPLETVKERATAVLEPAKAVLDEQYQYVEKLERALQTMANDGPEPHVDAGNGLKEPGANAPAVDSRRLLDEQQGGGHPREEGGLESALQTLAKMPRPRLMPFGSGAPSATEPAPQQAEDAPQQQPRKLGVVRVA